MFEDHARVASAPRRIADDIAHWLDAHVASLYIILSLLFGALYIVITPPNGTPDEISHQVKIARVASGNLFGADRDRRIADVEDWYVGFEDAALADANRTFSYQDILRTAARPLDCSARSDSQNDGVASYSPILYMPSTIVYLAACRTGASLGGYLYLARAINLLTYSLIVFVSLRRCPAARWVILPVALLPSVLYQAASVSGDALFLALALAFITVIAQDLSEHGTRSDARRACILALAVVVAVTKPGYV